VKKPKDVPRRKSNRCSKWESLSMAHSGDCDGNSRLVSLETNDPKLCLWSRFCPWSAAQGFQLLNISELWFLWMGIWNKNTSWGQKGGMNGWHEASGNTCDLRWLTQLWPAGHCPMEKDPTHTAAYGEWMVEQTETQTLSERRYLMCLCFL
jgi:hypothetical protein